MLDRAKTSYIAKSSMALDIMVGKSLCVGVPLTLSSDLVIFKLHITSFYVISKPLGWEEKEISLQFPTPFPRAGVDGLVSININYNLVSSKFPIYIHYLPSHL